MHYTYIIYAASIDKYYIGETSDFESRLAQHNSHYFSDSFTTQASDWVLFLLIECNDIKHARRLEQFIKAMKSRKFIQSLKSDLDKLNDIVRKTA